MNRQQKDDLCAKVWAAAFVGFSSKSDIDGAIRLADKVVEEFLKKFNLS